jgi:hypothetical protein
VSFRLQLSQSIETISTYFKFGKKKFLKENKKNKNLHKKERKKKAKCVEF